MSAENAKRFNGRLLDLMRLILDPEHEGPWVPRAKEAGFTDTEIEAVQKASEKARKERFGK